MKNGSQIILREPVIIVEDTADTIFLAKGTIATILSHQDDRLVISADGKEYSNIPWESVEVVRNDKWKYH